MKTERPFASRICPRSALIASLPDRLSTLRAHHTFSIKNALANHLFSIITTLIQKSAYLIENTRKTPICNSLIFNRLRTLSHSSPGSPVLSTCSPKHTRGCTPFAIPTSKVSLEISFPFARNVCFMSHLQNLSLRRFSSPPAAQVCC